MLAPDNMEWTNMCSLSEFHYAKDLPFKRDIADSNIQRNKKRLFGTGVGFWHLANWLVTWFGVTLFILQQWLILS